MSITDFIESLEKKERFSNQIVEQRCIASVGPRFKRLDLDDTLRDALAAQGIERFWSHQVEAVDLVRQGNNVIVMTPTASGKSLIYNIPVKKCGNGSISRILIAILRDPSSTWPNRIAALLEHGPCCHRW